LYIGSLTTVWSSERQTVVNEPINDGISYFILILT